MDSEEFVDMAKRMVDYMINYFETINERSVLSTYYPGYLKKMLPPTAPEKGESFEKIMEDVDKYIMPGLTHRQHPGFHAYSPRLSSYPVLLVNVLKDIIRCVGFNWNTCPEGSEIAAIALYWYGHILGLPQNFLHYFGSTNGGSMIQNTISNCFLISLVSARNRVYKKITSNRPNMSLAIVLCSLVAYCSRECHHYIKRVAMLSLVNVKILDTDEDYRLRGKTLANAIAEDKKIGLIPFYVHATLGMGCGACDALEEIGPICEDHEIWLNVDATYGGNAFVCPEFRHHLNGIECVSSICICPSKWMPVYHDCVVLFVRGRLKITNYVKASQLKYIHGESEPWSAHIRETYEGFKLLTLLHSFGVSGLQEHIRNHVRLATLFEGMVKADERFEVLSCYFGIVCFRIKGPDELTKMLVKTINVSRKILVNSLIIGDKFAIRFIVCSMSANENDIRNAWDLINELANKVIITYEINNKILKTKDDETFYHFYRVL